MPAYKHRSRWRYRFTLNGRRYSGSAPKHRNTKVHAEHLEKQHIARVEGGVTVAKAPTIAEFAPRFLEYQKARTKATTHRRQKSQVEKHIVPHVGHVRLDQFSTRDADALITAWRTSKLGARTCNGQLFTLGRMFSLAVEWQLLVRVPKVSRLKVPNDTPRFLSEDEAARLLDAMPQEWWSMALVALRTGLRIGELRGLQWADVDFDRSVIQVRRTDPGRKGMASTDPKGGRERTVPLTPDTINALRDHYHRTTSNRSSKPTDWIWCGKVSRSRYVLDRPRSESWCLAAMERATALAKLTDVGWHTLRHTYASWCVMRGVPISAVQVLLGHASIKQTERYAHLAPGFVNQALVASLDAPLLPDANQNAAKQRQLPSGNNSK